MQEHATFISDQTIKHLVAGSSPGVHHRLILPPIQILNQVKNYSLPCWLRCQVRRRWDRIGRWSWWQWRIRRSLQTVRLEIKDQFSARENQILKYSPGKKDLLLVIQMKGWTTAPACMSWNPAEWFQTELVCQACHLNRHLARMPQIIRDQLNFPLYPHQERHSFTKVFI